MKTLQKGFTLIELMIVVAIIGILAAVAIPAYQGFIAKSQAAEAFTLLDGLKGNMIEAFSQDQAWVIPGGAITSGKYVANITASAVTNDLVATFNAATVSDQIQSKSVTFTFNKATNVWTCTSTLPADIKPKSC